MASSRLEIEPVDLDSAEELLKQLQEQLEGAKDQQTQSVIAARIRSVRAIMLIMLTEVT